MFVLFITTPRIKLKIMLLLACRKERNSHAKLLLEQLKSNKLGPPFTEDPPIGLLSMPVVSQPPSHPADQNNELDSLLTSVLSPSHHTLPRSRGSPSHYRRTSSHHHVDASEVSSLTDLPQNSEHTTSNLDPQRQFSYGDVSTQTGPRAHHKTESSQSFEPQFHSTAIGGTSLRHTRAPGRVHYSDTLLYLGGHPGKSSPSRHTTSRVSSHDRSRSIQSNFPNGTDSFSSNDLKFAHRPTATSSRNRGSSHHLSSSTARRDDVMDGWSFPRGQEVVEDDDVLMVDDLDSLSDDLLVGGASYGDTHLQGDGELSDTCTSELLVMPPQPMPTTSVSGELKL